MHDELPVPCGYKRRGAQDASSDAVTEGGEEVYDIIMHELMQRLPTAISDEALKEIGNAAYEAIVARFHITRRGEE